MFSGARRPDTPLPAPAPDTQTEPEVDWVEWRANEFMGAFLAPRRLLHRHMHKRAAALSIPMVESPYRGELPIVCPYAMIEEVDSLVSELAEMFGLSVPFMEVRLRKYGLVSRRVFA